MKNVELDKGGIIINTNIDLIKNGRKDIECLDWRMYLEYVCEYCGEGFSSPNSDAKHCCRSCALKDRECKETTKLILSNKAKQQWETDRTKLESSLAKRDLTRVSEHARILWKNPDFRNKIQTARKAVGYPDPNRPEQIVKRKIRAAAKNALRRCLKHLSLTKTDKTFKLLGYTQNELKERIESLFVSGMSWETYGEWEIDHIQPISSFPPNTPLSVINALNNLQPLWKTENRKKRNKYVKLSSNS